MSKRVLLPFREKSRIAPYEAAVRDAGMEPVSKEADQGLVLGDVFGLLLTGGTDVSPQLYGEEPAPETDEHLDLQRDETEMALIAEALYRDLPIFAICRGLQILNVQHGGTLIQHLDTSERHKRRTPDPSVPIHPVAIAPGTKLREIAGTESWQVNSRHHQAAGKVGGGLIVSALDPVDGVIEGLERPDKRFVVAVQWHPEDQAPVNDQQRRLFKAFCNAL
jgi:putative glutamine amidotransferase